MKAVIAGSRNITDPNIIGDFMRRCFDRYDEPTHLISGQARGVDSIAEQLWVEEFDRYEEDIIKFPVTEEDYQKYGKGAPMIRNSNMAEIADAVFVLWDGKSAGSKHMIKVAKHKGVPHVYSEIVVDDDVYTLWD